MLTVMPQTHTLSNRSRLSPSSKYQTLLDCFLADFQNSLNAFARAWNKYQPNDSLSNDRKQDLDWLESTLQEYKISIQTSTSSKEFWKGCKDGKQSRRTISDFDSPSVAQTLLNATANPKATQIYDLGFQVGWRYVRLKDYLLRIRKQRKLEESQQLQDYRQFLSFIRQKADSEDMDSFVSFGWRRERKSGQ
ncbi:MULTISPECIES: hypothetical protein [unclassified Microcoleus]|jgi:hypothetical protein|uniref:hypothetical protein n=1 Tax=unclassified Microcoleus TaxID=2642155 RepID=UPI002FD04FE4